MAQSAHVKLAAAKAQLVAITAKIAELEQAAANEVDFSLVVAGSTVTFDYGKKPNVRSLTGMVLGRKDPAAGEKGASQVKVAVGEGFDATVFTIYLPYITKVSAPVVEDAAPLAEAAAE